MEKKTASAIMLTLLLASIIALAFRIQLVRAEPKVISVPTDYSTIQAAIYAANPGDTIFVYNGTYYENVVVNKNDLTLIGQNRSNTVIDGKETGSVIIISASNVIIKEFTVRNSAAHQSGIYIGWSLTGNVVRNNIITSNYCGISILVSNSITVADNSITNNKFGFYIVQSSDNNVIGNIITDNEKGVWLDWSNLNTIANNSIAKNSVFGIGLYRSSGNTIRRNALVNNSVGVTLFGGAGIFSNDNVIYHNNFINNTSQVQSEESINFWDRCYPAGGNYWSDYTEVDADGDGIGDTPYIIDSSNQDSYPLIHQYGSVVNLDTNLTYLTIQSAINAPETSNGHMIFVKAGTYYENVFVNKSLNIFGEDKYTTIIAGSPGYTAIAVVSDNVCISGFTMQNASNGVISHAQNVVVDSNLIVNCENSGLQMATTNNTIRNNFIENCGTAALFYGSNHTIEKNTFMNNTGWSIQLSYGSSNNRVTGNVIIDNDGTGIFLQSSHSNTISANTLMNNREGIRIGYSTGNLIFHNNLVNNTRQVFIDPGNINTTWDDGYPSGGNYWSDYAGVDLNHDGIGDMSYVIDANNHDNYPLMGVFSDFNATSECQVQTICNSTISAFQFNGTAIVFKVAGEGGTTGFCRICISTALMNSPYDVLVDGIEFPFTLLSCSNAIQSYLYFAYAHSMHEIIIRTHAVPPPPLAVSISPVSASIYLGQLVTFTSTTSGGTLPYSYQWYLNGNPVSGATSNTWAFTPTTSGIYYVHVKVTDAKANTAQSDAARIAVATVPVGGYSFPIQVQTKAEPVLPYIALIATLTAIFTKLRPKAKRKR